MNSFSQFNIKAKSNGFDGDKIEIYRLFNKLIVITKFTIEDSRFKERGNGKCLYAQIIVDNTKRLLFTGSVRLQEMIQEVPPDGFPFTTTIIKENDSYKFT